MRSLIVHITIIATQTHTRHIHIINPIYENYFAYTAKL